MAADGGRPLDLVLFGASGFVGRLVAGHLARHAPTGLRIGLAGRSRPRLAEVRDANGAAAAGWELVEADALDAASMAELAASTRVVATTVGPYARFGLPLVRACAEAGTHTCDLTGEVLFARACVDEVHPVAARTGARIVNACGFDSVPSDLGVLLTAQQARADGQGTLTDTTLVLVSSRGGFSGGTVDSLRNQLDEVRADPDLRAVVADPYALSPDRGAEPGVPVDPDSGTGRDPELGGWFGPFVMAPFNTRIVRRSNALQDHAYGRTFRYREVMSVGNSLVGPVLAGAVAAGTAGLAAGLSFKPSRALLDRILPDPGEGPSEKVRAGGHFRMDIHARTTGGARYVTTVSAKGDPGYAATSVMFGESALCLASDAVLPDAAGVLTPATAMGGVLADRLRARGLTLEVRRVDG